MGTLYGVKRWHYIVLLGLASLGAAYLYLHRQELGLVGSQDSGAAETASANPAEPSAHPVHIIWQTVSRPTDGFKVEMPTDLREVQLPAYNDSGGSDQIDMIYANPSADTTFSVSWADDPPVVRASSRSPEKVLDTARDEALARTQTSLVTESKSASGGFPSRVFTARNVGGGVMDCRLIYAGSRLYMLTAAFPSMGARREQDVTRFFSSFTVLQSSSIPTTLPAASGPRTN